MLLFCLYSTVVFTQRYFLGVGDVYSGKDLEKFCPLAMQIFFLKITITIITAHIEITPVILHLVFFILFFFWGGGAF